MFVRGREKGKEKETRGVGDEGHIDNACVLGFEGCLHAVLDEPVAGSVRGWGKGKEKDESRERGGQGRKGALSRRFVR